MASTGPPGARSPIRSAAAWRPSEIADTSEWTVVLTDDERQEIVEAVNVAQASGATVTTVDAASFPLPTLSGRAQAWSALLNGGRGFLLLRRFPVDLLDGSGTELAYIGLGCLSLGPPLSTLSGGERQRLKLATRIGDHAGVFVLDEPCSALPRPDVAQLLVVLARLPSPGRSRLGI